MAAVPDRWVSPPRPPDVRWWWDFWPGCWVRVAFRDYRFSGDLARVEELVQGGDQNRYVVTILSPDDAGRDALWRYEVGEVLLVGTTPKEEEEVRWTLARLSGNVGTVLP